MGVLACSRKHCENIMCDTHISSIGYICFDCQSEFKEYLNKYNLNPTTQKEITMLLSTFIKTEVNSYNEDTDEISVDDFFKKQTK